MVRIIRHNYLSGNLRKRYWAAAAFATEVKALFRPENKGFRKEVIRSQWRFAIGAVAPVAGETTQRARAAADWILRAQAATDDDGVSLGYFPCDSDAKRGWRGSYPETTGYIITTLLAFARQFDDPAVAAAASLSCSG